MGVHVRRKLLVKHLDEGERLEPEQACAQRREGSHGPLGAQHVGKRQQRNPLVGLAHEGKVAARRDRENREAVDDVPTVREVLREPGYERA